MNGRYFNAGVIYVNLKKWHEANFLHRIYSSFYEGKLNMALLNILDQDVLNIAFR
ncbi:glycosyltransferase [Escherichia coli]